MYATPVTDPAQEPGTSNDGEAALTLTLTSKRVAADGVALMTLGSPDGSTLPGWEPGAHIDVCLENGVTRQYSLVGDPSDRASYTIAVLRAPDSRGGSSYIHDALHAGQQVRVQGPRNHFPLVPADEYLFIAGGIGITPIAAMIRHVESQGRPWRLVYGGRTLSSMFLREELAELGGPRVDFWPQDERGIIDLQTVLADPRAGTAVYACGPEPLLEAVEKICADTWPTGALHLERFTAKQVDGLDDTEFEIELARSGTRLTVPVGTSVLDALAGAGVHVISSCGEGTCGTCETAVLEGEPDHRDSVLTPEEHAANDCMMVCVSRARCPRLVLDL